MPREVTIQPPLDLVGMEKYITEGWNAWFANKESADNPYCHKTQFFMWRAWKYGFFEAMDYGN